MSRGLGERQRLALVALLHLEEQADAQHAAWKQAQADYMVELEVRAAAGDVEAAQAVSTATRRLVAKTKVTLVSLAQELRQK